MKLSTKGKTLNITLGGECTIIDVEAHTDLVRSRPKTIEQIYLKIDGLTQMDTAYLQCLYSLKKEAEHRHISIQIQGKSRELDHICRLYGLEAIRTSSGKKKKKSTGNE